MAIEPSYENAIGHYVGVFMFRTFIHIFLRVFKSNLELWGIELKLYSEFVLKISHKVMLTQ